MLLIHCPYCGPRDEIEFRFGGEAHVVYPDESVDNEAWGRFLFVRHNPKGAFAERWLHQHGCRRWFNVVRDTVTHEISASYPAGQPRPEGAE